MGWPRIRWRFRSRGRNIVSVNKRALALGKARMTTEVSEIDASAQIVSCGTPLPGLDVKIVDPERHFALKEGLIGEIWIAGSSKCQGYWKNPETDAQAVSCAAGRRQPL